MRYIIEVEETVKIRHQIIIDVEDEEEVDRVLDSMNDYYDELDDCIDDIAKMVDVLEVNEEYCIQTDGVEYYNDYEDE